MHDERRWETIKTVSASRYSLGSFPHTAGHQLNSNGIQVIWQLGGVPRGNNAVGGVVLVIELEVWCSITAKARKGSMCFYWISQSTFYFFKMNTRDKNVWKLSTSICQSSSRFYSIWWQCVPITPTLSLHALSAHIGTLDVTKPHFPITSHATAAQDHTLLSSHDLGCCDCPHMIFSSDLDFNQWSLPPSSSAGMGNSTVVKLLHLTKW